MSKKEDGLIFSAPSIKTLDGQREVTVDQVRLAFINSDANIEEIAAQMNLPVATVRHYAEQGLEAWHELRQARLTARMNYFMNFDIDNVMETHSTLEDAHFLELIQIKDAQKFLKAYYLTNGHLYMMVDGEIKLDNYGMPIPMPLPNTPKHLMQLEGVMKLKETTKQFMNNLHEVSKKEGKKDIEIIDVDNYGIFDKEEK